MIYRKVAASLMVATVLLSSTAFAAVDPVKKAIDLLGSAVPTIQAQMVSMSQGCWVARTACHPLAGVRCRFMVMGP